MRPLFKVILLCNIIIFFSACSVKPKPIEYGVDSCAFCDMTIIDNKFSAELVTEKGKVYKFDAIECMLRYNYKNVNHPIELYLIADYANPGELVDAHKSTFLVSKNIPSPMGSYLSGYKLQSDAQSALNSEGGARYDWDQINKYINTN